MYTTLEKIKAHLNIDSDYCQDDDYLVHLAIAAESAVAKRLNIKSLSSIMTQQGYLPEDVSHAILILIGTWFSSRESYTTLSVNKIPHSLDFLFDLNRNFSEPF